MSTRKKNPVRADSLRRLRRKRRTARDCETKILIADLAAIIDGVSFSESAFEWARERV